MAILTNQIRVLLQRVKMAGREPHKILMCRGLRDALYLELNHVFVRGKVGAYDAIQGATDTFEGIPVVVDESCVEPIIQVKPRAYDEKDIVSPVPWSKIMKMKRL